MRMLHTSDWHLGCTLYGRKRYEEFEAFLEWLAKTVERERIDVLVVSGDIFDTTTPSNRAQSLYYRFLHKVAASPCRHIVITAGNHDSPTFLNAPKELLEAMGVHVVGAATENLEEEVLVLRDAAGNAQMIVCAVPYLRDRDIRVAEAGESVEEKERKLTEGIRDHYARVAALAEEKRAKLGGRIPVVATGHLFAAGGQTVEGDGVRKLYVGSLAHVSPQIFPDTFDYVALGHLHVPQKVGGSETIRYSGSPLPMGFGEAKQQKSVCVVEFAGREAKIRLCPVPVFQRLERIRGDWEEIVAGIKALKAQKAKVWVEIVYEGKEAMGDLREKVETLVDDSDLEVLRVKNGRVVEGIMRQMQTNERLDDLDVYEVFRRCLEAHEIPQNQREELNAAYREIVVSLDEEDIRAQRERT